MTDATSPGDPRALCTACGGTAHHTCVVDAGGGGSPSLLPLGFLTAPRYDLLICGSCGLTRWFVQPEFMPAVRDRLPLA